MLAPGSINRELPQWPAGMERVHYLRNEQEARALKSALVPGKRLLIVGGGLIGLEVAASAATLGLTTTVLEVAPRILARVCDEETGALIADTHRRHGVALHTAETIEHVRPHDAGVEVETKSGKAFSADLVVVGAGVKPNVALAAAAGLATDDGIVVDAHCRTSDPAILACGDAVRFPGPAGPIRLENWRHAQDHGMVAGRNAAGGADIYKACRRSGRSNTISTSRASAGRRRRRARACAARSTAAGRWCSGSPTARSRPRWASTRNATSRWCGG